MPFNEHDAADLLEQLAQTRAERDALRRALVEHAGALAAAQHLGDAAYGPIVAASLAVEVDDKSRVTVKITDAAGRARTKFDTNTRKFAAFTAADLAAEITARWPQLAKNEKPAPTDDKAGDPPNLTEQMRRERAAQRVASAKLSDAERAAAQARNPWSVPTFNLTEQMRVQRLNPALAEQLQHAAGV